MAENLRDWYKQNQTEPVMTTVGRGTASVAGNAAQAVKNMGFVANQAPKLVGTPAAGIANAAAAGGANFMTGFTGQKYTPNVYEGKSVTDLFSSKPALKAIPSIASAAPAGGNKASAPIETPVYKGPQTVQPKYVEDTTSPLAEFRNAQYQRDGLGTTTGYTGPGSIDVARQANGNLSFTGVGTPGTSGVRYTGLPEWQSKKGGAGQGSVDFGGEAFKPAQAMVARGEGVLSGMNNPAVQYRELADKIARGVGGAVGVAQNKIAFAGLGDILQRQMASQSALQTANIGAETQRRGQDIDATANTARTAASKYSADIAAKTAAEANETHKQQVAATLAAAGAKTMDPAKMSKAAMSELQLSLILGKTRDGKAIDPAVREDLTKRFMALGGNSNYMMYNSSAAEAE